MDEELWTEQGWTDAWNAAVELEDVDRLAFLFANASPLPAEGPASLPAALQHAFQSDRLVTKGLFFAILVDCLADWDSWSREQQVRLLHSMFPKLTHMKSSPEVALLGDWISEAAPVPTAKEWLISMIRQRPDEVGDVLFSMRTRFFKRLERADEQRAMDLHRWLYELKVEDAEVWAREHEKLWGMRD